MLVDWKCIHLEEWTPQEMDFHLTVKRSNYGYLTLRNTTRLEAGTRNKSFSSYHSDPTDFQTMIAFEW
jgi:hypothetical protein